MKIILEKNIPNLLQLAQYLAFFSLSLVVLSTITFIISTMEELQEDSNGQNQYPNVVLVLELVDTMVVIVFTVEYLGKFQINNFLLIVKVKL